MIDRWCCTGLRRVWHGVVDAAPFRAVVGCIGGDDILVEKCFALVLSIVIIIIEFLYFTRVDQG
jgi:hypothetical protein